MISISGPQNLLYIDYNMCMTVLKYTMDFVHRLENCREIRLDKIGETITNDYLRKCKRGLYIFSISFINVYIYIYIWT